MHHYKPMFMLWVLIVSYNIEQAHTHTEELMIQTAPILCTDQTTFLSEGNWLLIIYRAERLLSIKILLMLDCYRPQLGIVVSL